MNGKKRRRWSERTRMLLTLQLAVVLPAAALIVASILNLRDIQRGRGVEATIQRDFMHVLKITEKTFNERAFKTVAKMREKIPCPAEPVSATMDALLEKYPMVAHAFYYCPASGLVVRSQPRRMGDIEFRHAAERFASDIRWVKTEGKGMLEKFFKMEQEGGDPFYFYNMISKREGRLNYESLVVSTLPACGKEQGVLAGVVLDSDFLKEAFFPAVLDSILEKQGEQGSNPAGMMIHIKKDSTPLATSADWDGGEPEVEKAFEPGSAFPGLVLGIKFRGTTIEAMSNRFLLNSFLIIGGLSIFLAFGVWLTYRNVSREMALARLKADFVANVSHELRTPLALIRLYAETLEMGRLTNPDKPQEYYRIIREESERLSALINNILDFSRIEAGRKEYDFHETNLAELVRSTLEAYRYQIEQNGFAFESRIADDVPPVRVDREAIARSLLNLVNNAVKYSSNDKFLGVNLYRANGSVKLEVVDHGIGIPSAEQNKIFEKFYRVGDPLVHNTKGSGLGLSLVRHIVQAHGGNVSVESTPGKGSKFTIALPIAASA
ncbi:MAG: HAMP domain-containing histidine kinase [Acidobacteria bacterium]|nr:HAMP domain-containing histidine kinase [Acidobacteriota bacterium]